MVTAEDVRAYERDGAVCVRGCISAEWLGHLRRAAAALEARPGPSAEAVVGDGDGTAYFTELEMAQRLPDFEAWCRSGPSAEIAGRLMQSRHACFLYDQYFSQRWPDGPCAAAHSTPYHQDQPYWSVCGRQVASVWVPLDPVPPGADVVYVAGSHRWAEHSPFHFATGAQYAGTGLPPLPDIEAGVAAGTLRLLRWDVEPGDAIVFSGMTVHGQRGGVELGGGTAGAGQFRRVATRWTGEDAVYALRQGEARDVIPSTRHPCELSPGDPMECGRFPRAGPGDAHGARLV